MLTLLILSGASDEADIILGPRFGTMTISELGQSRRVQQYYCSVNAMYNSTLEFERTY
jgi:hypothetical protein